MSLQQVLNYTQQEKSLLKSWMQEKRKRAEQRIFCELSNTFFFSLLWFFFFLCDTQTRCFAHNPNYDVCLLTLLTHKTRIYCDDKFEHRSPDSMLKTQAVTIYTRLAHNRIKVEGLCMMSVMFVRVSN